MNKIIINILTILHLKTAAKRFVNSILGLKIAVKRMVNSIGIYFQFYSNKYFNATVKAQNKNLKSIPIIIISFNQVFYLKKLINFLVKNKYKNIIIIDNNSTYQPLLDYFKTINNEIKIHQLSENMGHIALWKQKELFDKYTKGYYVVTDPDIVPITDCPSDFLMYFKNILDKSSQVTKAGFSLRLDDIPNSNKNKESILKWESQFWRNKLEDGNYKAKIDTTFALYRPNYKYKKSNFLTACRTSYPYIAVHGGWYIDSNHLTDEQQFYFENCNESSTWRIDIKGNLKDTLYQN